MTFLFEENRSRFASGIYGCRRVRVGVKEGFVVFSYDWYLLKNWGKLVLLYIHMICGLQSQALQYYTYVTLYMSLLC